jgi:outer membrane protein TolC
MHRVLKRGTVKRNNKRRVYAAIVFVAIGGLSTPSQAGQIPASPTPNRSPSSPGSPQPLNRPAAGQETTGGASTLTLLEAVSRAQTRSFVSQQYDARVAGAAARLTGAGKLQNPVASIGGHFGNNAGGTDEDYILSQSFELGDKRRQRVLAGRAERDAAVSDRTTARNDLAFTVQSAYFEAQRAEAARQLAQNALDNARKFAEAAQLQFTAGDVAQSQVTRSRIEQTRQEQALVLAETDRANRIATLRSLVRLSETEPLTLPATLAFTPTSYKLDALQTFALAHRPDLQSAQQLRASREAQVHGARAQSQPDLFVEARHATIDPTPAGGGNTLRFGLLFPLLDLGRNRSDVASARAALTEQEAVIAETRRIALLDVETAFRNLEQARRAVESFQNGRMDRSRELADQAQLGYSQGANTYLELLDAQQIYRTEQTDYVRALADYNIARAALQRAVGGQLP